MAWTEITRPSDEAQEVNSETTRENVPYRVLR